MVLKFFPNIVVWGDKYVESFLRNTVPTLLAGGNLEVLSHFPGSEFLIVCPAAEQELIKRSPEFPALERCLPVRFLDLDWDMAAKSHSMLNMSEGHKRIATYIGSRDGFAIFLSPDCILSAGAVRYLVNVAESGLRAVVAPGIRLIKELVVPELDGRRESGRLNLSGRDLVIMFHRFAHAEMDGYFTDSSTFTRYPHYVFWRTGGGTNFVGRAFHLHPVMVQIPPDPDLRTLDHDTIDGDFVGRLVGDFSKIKVVGDSDDLVIFSLSSQADLRPEAVTHAFMPNHVAQWAYCGNNKAIHRFYFTQPFVMHDTNVDEQEVNRLIEQTGRVAHDILSHPEPIQYVGYAHDKPHTSVLARVSTLALIAELRVRARPFALSKLVRGIKHLIRGVGWEVDRMAELKVENALLRQAVTDLTLEKQMMKEGRQAGIMNAAADVVVSHPQGPN